MGRLEEVRLGDIRIEALIPNSEGRTTFGLS
jgi:hypothetical protein